MVGLSRVFSVTGKTLLLIIGLCAVTGLCADPLCECPRCTPHKKPNPGSVVPADAVFCVLEEADWAPELCWKPCDPNYVAPPSYWSVAGAVDKDFCNDPGEIDDGWCVAMTLTGVSATFLPGKVRFEEPGTGTVKASFSDLGEPGCGDPRQPGEEWLSVPANVYVIGSKRKPTISCYPMVYICDPANPTNQPPATVTAPDVAGQPAGTVIGWEIQGPAECVASPCQGASVQIRCNRAPGCMEMVRFRATYTLRGKTCYSQWEQVEAITPTALRLTVPPAGQPSGTTITGRAANGAICSYETIIWFQVLDQCGRDWPTSPPSTICLDPTMVNELLIPCCDNHREIQYSSRGFTLYGGGVFMDRLATSWCPSPIPEDLHKEIEQEWRVHDCPLPRRCLHFYYDHGESVAGSCPGPCSGGMLPCPP